MTQSFVGVESYIFLPIHFCDYQLGKVGNVSGLENVFPTRVLDELLEKASVVATNFDPHTGLGEIISF